MRKLALLIAIGLPLRSMIHPRRGGTGMSWTRLLSRQQLVLLVLSDREPAHAADQHRADGRLSSAKQHHPARKGDRLMRVGEPDVLHRLSLHASMRGDDPGTNRKDADRNDEWAERMRAIGQRRAGLAASRH